MKSLLLILINLLLQLQYINKSFTITYVDNYIGLLQRKKHELNNKVKIFLNNYINK